MTTNKSRTIDFEILNLNSGLFEGPPPPPVYPMRDVDVEVASLSGAVFESLPFIPVPLDSFRPPPPSRPHADSLAPTTDTTAAPPPPPPSVAAPVKRLRASRVALVGALAAALGVLAGVSAQKQQVIALVDDQVWVSTSHLAAMQTPVLPATDVAPEKVAPTAKPSAKRAFKGMKLAAKPADAPPADAKPADVKPADAPPPDDLALAPVAIAAPPPAVDIDRAGASAAIAIAARRAAACLDPDDARGSMPVSVTFAPSGRVTRATLEGGPHIGTAAGSCIARTLRTATVGAFEGTPVTISTGIRIR